MGEEPRGPRRALPDFLDDERPPRSRGARRALPEDTRHEPGSRRGVVVAALAVALALLVGGIYLYFGRRTSAEPTPMPTPAPSTAQPSASEEPPGVQETVGDSTITLPHDWELYYDELTEGDRRLIRAQDATGDVRLQVATLTSIDEDIAAACSLLVADQSTDYTVDFRIEPQPVAVSGEARAVVCGYVGAKEQNEATSVRFTLIRRDSDEHTLVVRTTRPQALKATHEALTDAAAMTCEASRTFKHPLALC